MNSVGFILASGPLLQKVCSAFLRGCLGGGARALGSDLGLWRPVSWTWPLQVHAVLRARTGRGWCWEVPGLGGSSEGGGAPSVAGSS